MKQPKWDSVDAYLADQPDAARVALKRVRRAIREAVPEAEESISYNIPTYKIGGKPVIYFAGWKEHYSIYPLGPAVVAAFAEELKGRSLSKGTIRFPLSEPVPELLIGGIARVRAGKPR